MANAGLRVRGQPVAKALLDARREAGQSAPLAEKPLVGVTDELLSELSLIEQLWQPAFPSTEQVQAAASMIPGQPAGSCQEGPSWRITVTPGRVRIWTRDEAKAERTANRQRDAGSTGNRWEGEHECGDLCDQVTGCHSWPGTTGNHWDGEHECTDKCVLVKGRIRHFWPLEHLCSELCDATEDEPTPKRGSTREITRWSAKSRANMCGRLSDLDYAPLFTDPTRVPAMLTLTYPGDWLIVAPNGRAAKRHLDKLRKRYKRAYGEDLICVWKLEFQHRGAPHFHLLMTPPHKLLSEPVGLKGETRKVTFKQWISRTWADIVNHPDQEEYAKHLKAGVGVDYAEGMKANDPRRVAVYFSKHGAFRAKEYQHCVPEAWREPGQGPGRFWGYWGLTPVEATTAVSGETGVQAGRMVRRYSRAQQVTREVSRPRVRGGRVISKYHDVIGLAGAQLLAAQAPTKYRTTRTRAVRAKNSRGWIAVNNGPDFGSELAYGLQLYREQHHRDTDRATLRRCGWWSTPLARARRLTPGPRRDALIAALEQRAGSLVRLSNYEDTHALANDHGLGGCSLRESESESKVEVNCVDNFRRDESLARCADDRQDDGRCP